MNTVHLSEESKIVLVSIVQKFLNDRKLIEPGYVLAGITLETRPVIVDGGDSLGSLSLDAKLAQPVNVLNFVERAGTIRWLLDAAGLYTVGQLVRMTEQSLRKYRSVGNRTISSLKTALEREELRLGMFLPVGPLEKAFYRRQRISEPHLPERVVMMLISCGIQTYGDVLLLNFDKKREVTQCLGQMSKEDSKGHYSLLNEWLNTYPTGESRFQRLCEFAETFGMKTQNTSFF